MSVAELPTSATSRLHRGLLVAGALAGVAFLAARGVAPVAVAVLLKAVPLTLLIFAVARVARRGSLQGGILVGLVLSLLGDVVLEVDGERLFIPGLVAFLLGHVAYVWAFTRDTLRLAPVQGAVFALWGVLALYGLGPYLGDLLAPVAVYVAVICAMMWRATARIGMVAPLDAWWGALGALSFGISDTTLAVNKFHTPFAAAPLLIMVTYWLGQLGIAAAAVGAPERSTPR